MRFLLAPLTWPYGIVMGVRNRMYDWKILGAPKSQSKVVAIGNVTVGGTGKTPILLALAEYLGKKKIKLGVVSRGYKRKTTGVWEVKGESTSEMALQFGDEPTLIKSNLNGAPVYVGEKRIKAVKSLEETYGKVLILADDAFQHRKLHRDLNILLLDAFDEPSAYRLLPWGRGRERLKRAVRRADYLVLTKANLLNSDKLKSRLEWIKKSINSANKPLIRADYVLDGFQFCGEPKSPAKANEATELKSELKDKAYLISAVARPESVEEMIKDRVKLIKHQIFADHHDFTDNEIEGVLNESSRLGARWILCTEKDWVKLKKFSRLRDRLWVIKLKIKFEGEINQLYEDISRLVRT